MPQPERQRRRRARAYGVVRTLGAALAAGYVLFFFGEAVFWGRPDRAPLPDLLASWIAYSVLAAALLSVLAVFKVRNLPGLVLAGAVYGWLVEGVLVGTMYDAFPLNLSWTGLAWHDLIAVVAGWYGLQAGLRHSARRAALIAAGLGLFWGTWAVMWWQPQEGGFVTPLPDFALHTLFNTLGVVVAFAVLQSLVVPSAFRKRGLHLALAAIVVLWFAVVIVPALPLALAISPPLFALTLWALARQRRIPPASPVPHDKTTILDTLHTTPPRSRYVTLLCMPACATIVYAFIMWSGAVPATNFPLFWLLTPLGLGAYLVSLWVTVRRKQRG